MFPGHAKDFLPLSHPPGEAQVDFGEATIKRNGVERKAALFVMTLPYSGAIFIQAFPRECPETFLEGRCRALEFLGGVPRRIRYDTPPAIIVHSDINLTMSRYSHTSLADEATALESLPEIPSMRARSNSEKLTTSASYRKIDRNWCRLGWPIAIRLSRTVNIGLQPGTSQMPLKPGWKSRSPAAMIPALER